MIPELDGRWNSTGVSRSNEGPRHGLGILYCWVVRGGGFVFPDNKVIPPASRSLLHLSVSTSVSGYRGTSSMRKRPPLGPP